MKAGEKQSEAGGREAAAGVAPGLERAEAELKRCFGHDGFRGGQRELVEALLSGRDVMGVMPTGGGKSICYQLPAVVLPGTALVISPLISLMKDQVTALRSAGVAAAYINSTLTAEEYAETCERMRGGRYKLVYVAPERLDTAGFVSVTRDSQISLVAVDEAHCISQWGQDFRPSYLRITDFLEKLPQRPPVGAFTATATRAVREDVIRILRLRRPLCVTTGFDRPNLYFDVLRPREKYAMLRELVSRRRDRSGIIYCATRRTVESVCAALRADGFEATRYHAGLEAEERRQNQEDFIYDRRSVMVATNAFGMGIDKSNVGYVIHYNMPKSLEAYYQEAGRAGRDGERADCILLFAPGDVATALRLIALSGQGEGLSAREAQAVRARDRQRLREMADYCQTHGCLRGYILDYFGQEHPERCGNCGNCLADFQEKDVTREAQILLSCVKRIHSHLGYYMGLTAVSDCLRGSKNSRTRELGLDSLSTYGLMRGSRPEAVRELVELLAERGYLERDGEYGVLALTERAGEVLFRGERVLMPVRLERADKGGAPTAKKPAARRRETAEPDGELYEALRMLRFRLSQEHRVPPYVIFSNATLSDMSAKRPRNVRELLEVSGVGEAKAQRYGEDFLKEIENWRKKRNG